MVPPQVLYELGAEWYATRFDADWVRPDAAQASAVFARHGLTAPFWTLPE